MLAVGQRGADSAVLPVRAQRDCCTGPLAKVFCQLPACQPWAIIVAVAFRFYAFGNCQQVVDRNSGIETGQVIDLPADLSDIGCRALLTVVKLVNRQALGSLQLTGAQRLNPFQYIFFSDSLTPDASRASRKMLYWVIGMVGMLELDSASYTRISGGFTDQVSRRVAGRQSNVL